jgi:signal transduction histidine kinase
MATIATSSPLGRGHFDGGLVWVLEDSPVEADAIRAAIKGRHFVELFPDSGAILARIASASPPDVLVVASRVPAAGLELCRLLRASFDAQALPILVLSPHGDCSAVVNGLHAGANDYLTKPYDPAELVARVGTLVRTHQLGAALAVERQAREQAEAANRIKDEFLAMLSHELRGPLNAISGWVRMLRSGMVPPDGTERALATIERNTIAQSQLVEDLLDVSRIVSGRMTIDRLAVDLAEAVEGVVDSLRPVANEKGITLVAEIDRIGTIAGDPARLRQVATNLVTNALKFTPTGGRVTVSVRGDGSVAILRVTDSGQGIEASFLPHVFERFRQADASTARKQGGLGLGLAIVHHIAALHGGGVTAESEGTGRGATFTVKIPLATADSMPSSATRSVQSGDAGCENLRVVLVDDEPDGRELVARVLGQRGADVRTAGQVEEALAIVRADPPDVIVTDLGMPGASGFDFLKQLRDLPPAEGGHVPVIALTAYGQPEHRQQALRAGFDQFLTKPVDFDEVAEAVARLGRNPPLRARSRTD